jgi:DNA-directed RNA polymerase subunit K/omega
MKVKLSRALDLDVEKCVEQAGGNRFNLVLIATQRMRELRNQTRSSGKYIGSMTPLLDIQEGKVDPVKYLKRVK